MKPQPTNTPEAREPTKNHQILLSSRPRGEPSHDNFRLAETEIPKPGPGPDAAAGDLLSLDPYMRGRMNAGPSHAPPVEIGEVMGGQSVCGLIARSNAPELPPGPDHLPLLMRAILARRLTFHGFLFFDYASQFPDFVTDMKTWLSEGRIKYREDITDGLENAPLELIRLLKGENFGKKIIRVSLDPTAPEP